MKPSTVAARLPFYYGWVMLAVTVVATFAVYPGQTVGISEFNPHFERGLEVNQTELSGAYTLATFIAGVTALFAGAAMDRYGLRRTITVSVLLLGGACAFASQVAGLWTLFAAYLLLRIFGHGVLPLLTGNTLAMWFHRRLGLVTGIAGVAGSAVMAVVPFTYQRLIEVCGWRGAWLILGGLVCAVMLPIMAFVFHNRPEEIGQRIDGDAPRDRTDETADGRAGPVDTTVVSFDLAAAFRTPAYWALIGLSVGHGMIFAAVMFHRLKIFGAAGLAEADAATMVAVYSATLAGAQLIAGVFADRVPLHLLLFVAAVTVAVGLAILAQVDGLTTAYAFGAVLGLGTGIEIVGRNTIWPRYFGRAHLGKLRGSAAMATVMGSSLGPFIVGATYDRFESHAPGIWFLVAVYGAIAVAMLFATPPAPRRPDARPGN